MLVVNARDQWALALLLDHHDNRKRYHRAVSVVEWRANVASDSVLVPPRFPQRDAMLRVFQHEVCPENYPNMAWEVRMLDMGAVMRDPRQEWDHDGARSSSVPELAEGVCASGPLTQVLLEEVSKQRKLRLSGRPGVRLWPGADAIATYVVKGFFLCALFCLINYEETSHINIFFNGSRSKCSNKIQILF